MREPREITLKLPIHIWYQNRNLPLSLNQFLGRDRMVIHKLKNRYKFESVVPRLLEYRKQLHEGAYKQWTLTYQFTFANKSVKDPSNFWSVIEKIVLDTLVSTGYLSDDGHKQDRGRVALPTLYDNGEDANTVRITIQEVL